MSIIYFNKALSFYSCVLNMNILLTFFKVKNSCCGLKEKPLSLRQLFEIIKIIKYKVHIHLNYTR